MHKDVIVFSKEKFDNAAILWKIEILFNEFYSLPPIKKRPGNLKLKKFNGYSLQMFTRPNWLS